MSFAYKRISSLGTSHDPSAYMAEIVCRSSTHTHERLSSKQYRLEIQKQLLKWRESGHIWKITGQPSRQIVPSFAARISACFAYMEASVDGSGNC